MICTLGWKRVSVVAAGRKSFRKTTGAFGGAIGRLINFTLVSKQ